MNLTEFKKNAKLKLSFRTTQKSSILIKSFLFCIGILFFLVNFSYAKSISLTKTVFTGTSSVEVLLSDNEMTAEQLIYSKNLLNIEKEMSDDLASKYAKLYDGCKNK